MSDLVTTLRAIVRDELARLRPPSLGVVTAVHARADEGGDENHQVDVRLRDSGIELERVPVAVARIGLSALPAEGDLVLLAFVGGDLGAPVALGCLYHHEAQPPVAGPDEVVYQPPQDEASGVRRLHVELPNGATLTVEDAATELAAGGTTVRVNMDGDVEVTAKGNLKLTADGDLTLTAGGKVAVEARADLTLKGMNATLEGAASATVKGAQIKLAGMTDFSPS